MGKVRVGKDLTIQLPAELGECVHVDDEFVVAVEGRSLRLVPADIATILEKAAATPDPEQPTLEEINRIVHEIRRQP